MFIKAEIRVSVCLRQKMNLVSRVEDVCEGGANGSDGWKSAGGGGCWESGEMSSLHN